MKATLYGLTKNKNDIHVKSQLEKMLSQVSQEGAVVIDGANIAAESIYGKSIVAESIEATQIKAGAITSDHITAAGIVADKIKTGVLRSTNGASWLNLNDGTFSYANGNFTFQNGKMVIRAHTIELGGEEVPTKTQTEEYADNLGEELQGQIDTSIKSTEVEYYSSTSSTSPVGGKWSTTAPEWQEGRFMWSRTKITSNKGIVTYNPNETGTNISGATGSTGTGITSITEEYYLSTSKTAQEGGYWSASEHTWQPGLYMWTRNKIIYKNPIRTEYTNPLVDSAWEAINNIEIGTRNLLRDSNIEFSFGEDDNKYIWDAYRDNTWEVLGD